MLIVDTERLRLRVWTPEDQAAGEAIWGDPGVMRYVEPALDAEAVRASIARGIEHQRAHGVQHWAVEEKTTAAVVGCCGFNLYEGGPALELVFHFRRSAWGRGFASEAAVAALELVRSRGIRRIVASTAVDNAGANRVLEKLGMTVIDEQWFDDTQQRERIYELRLLASS